MAMIAMTISRSMSVNALFILRLLWITVVTPGPNRPDGDKTLISEFRRQRGARARRAFDCATGRAAPGCRLPGQMA